MLKPTFLTPNTSWKCSTPKDGNWSLSKSCHENEHPRKIAGKSAKRGSRNSRISSTCISNATAAAFRLVDLLRLWPRQLWNPPRVPRRRRKRPIRPLSHPRRSQRWLPSRMWRLVLCHPRSIQPSVPREDHLALHRTFRQRLRLVVRLVVRRVPPLMINPLRCRRRVPRRKLLCRPVPLHLCRPVLLHLCRPEHSQALLPRPNQRRSQ